MNNQPIVQTIDYVVPSPDWWLKDRIISLMNSYNRKAKLNGKKTVEQFSTMKHKIEARIKADKKIVTKTRIIEYAETWRKELNAYIIEKKALKLRGVK